MQYFIMFWLVELYNKKSSSFRICDGRLLLFKDTSRVLLESCAALSTAEYIFYIVAKSIQIIFRTLILTMMIMTDSTLSS